MMNIVHSVCKIINKYGCTAKIDNSGELCSVKAFFQPLRYRYREYSRTKRHLIGKQNSNSYIFVCSPDIELNPDKTVIDIDARKYIVKRCEIYYVQNSPIYNWAVLSHYGEALEDEYESD